MRMRHTHRVLAAIALATTVCCMARVANASPFPPAQGIGDLSGRIGTVASTVPPNGDVNPYGVAVVPMSLGDLVQNDVLVSNFNNSQNLQGTGTTIVEISPHGAVHVFAHINANKLPGPCPGGIGLTTALAVTSTGWVFVGSLPTTNGMSNTAKAGCILVLDRHGQVVETFAGAPINGPWDMTKFEQGQHVALFFTNVLNGTVAGGGHVVHRGTVVRMDLLAPMGMMPKITSMTVIGSGFSERTDPGALVIGPTGLGLKPNSDDALFVADSLNNRIAAIMNPLMRMSSAGTGQTVTMGGALNDPLGLTVTSTGDILTANGDDGFLVRTNDEGMQMNKLLLDNSGSPPGAGALFGLALRPGGGLYFVDDAQNTLMLLSQ